LTASMVAEETERRGTKYTFGSCWVPYPPDVRVSDEDVGGAHKVRYWPQECHLPDRNRSPSHARAGRESVGGLCCISWGAWERTQCDWL